MSKKYKKILVCVKDPSPKKILEESLEYAHKSNAKVVLLHVQDPEVETLESLKKELNSSLHFPDTHGNVPLLNTVDISLINEIESKHEQNAKKILDKSSQFLERHGIQFSKAIISGEPSLKIIEYSRKNKCDLIILGSKKGRLGRLILGSTSSKVKENSKTPVVVVKQ